MTGVVRAVHRRVGRQDVRRIRRASAFSLDLQTVNSTRIRAQLHDLVDAAEFAGVRKVESESAGAGFVFTQQLAPPFVGPWRDLAESDVQSTGDERREED